MGKITLRNISVNKILSFLEREKAEKVGEGQVIFVAVWSIVDFLVALCLVKSTILWGIVFSILCVAIIISLYYFIKKCEHTQKNNNFFQGIYTIPLMLSAYALTYLLLRQYFGREIYIVWFILISLSICTGIITNRNYIQRINSSEYTDSKKLITALVVGMVSMTTPFLSDINAYLLFGLLFGFVSITSSAGGYYFIKAYCYHVLEQEEKERGRQNIES